MTYRLPEVRGRLVPGLPPWNPASADPVPGRVDVPGLAKPVNGRPVFVMGRTAGLAPCVLEIFVRELLTYSKQQA